MTRVKNEPGAAAKAGQQTSAGGGTRKKPYRPVAPKFKGATEELNEKGCVFDVSADSQSKWPRMHHEAEEFCLRQDFKHAGEVAMVVRNMTPYKEPEIPMPDFDAMVQKNADGTDKLDDQGNPIKYTDTMIRVASRLYERQVGDQERKSEDVSKDMIKLYGILLGQCSPTMRAHLEADPNWENIDLTKDPVELLKTIQSVMYGQQTHQYLPLVLHKAVRGLVNIGQGDLTVDEYQKKFTAAVEAMEAVDATPMEHPALYKRALAALTAGNPTGSAVTAEQRKVARRNAREEYLATAFLLGLNKNRYEGMLTELANDLVKGKDNYPKTVEEAHSLAAFYHPSKTANTQTHTALMFNQDGVKDGQNKPRRTTGSSRIKCYFCGREHKQSECDAYRKASEAAQAGPADDASRGQVHQQGADAEGAQGDDDAAAMAQEMAEIDGYVNMQIGGVEVDALAPYEAFNFTHVGSSAPTLLLDNQSTIHCASDLRVLSSVGTAPERMKVLTNAGVTVTDQAGALSIAGRTIDLGGQPVWYLPAGIANIISLSKLRKLPHIIIKYDDGEDDGRQERRPSFIVKHRESGQVIMQFFETDEGLYAYEVPQVAQQSHTISTAKADEVDGNCFLTTQQIDSAVMVQTVEGNLENFTKRDILKAQQARQLQKSMCFPSDATMSRVMHRNLLPNASVTAVDFKNVARIYGPLEENIKGKAVEKKGKVVEVDITRVPRAIMSLHRNVTIVADIGWVNSVAFLFSLSLKLRFFCGIRLKSRRVKYIVRAMIAMKKTYLMRGFNIVVAKMDPEFIPLRPSLAKAGILLNECAQGDHIPEIERGIRTIKDRCRATFSGAPYKRVPAVMTVGLVFSVLLWLNAIPPADGTGVSKTISPRTLVTGLEIGPQHTKLQWGEYVQAHRPTDNTITTERSVGAIALGPVGNVQGSWYFMNLASGRRITCRSWTRIPAPQDVIDRVHALAKNERPGLLFRNRNGQPLDAEDIDENDEPYDGEDGDESPDDDDLDENDYEPIDLTPRSRKWAAVALMTRTTLMLRRTEPPTSQE